MVRRLCDIIPDAEDLLRLEPEVVGAAILETLPSLGARFRQPPSLDAYLLWLWEQNAEQYPRRFEKHLSPVLAEGWWWLERKGFLAPFPHHTALTHGNRIITRLGKAYPTTEKVAAYRKARSLPEALIHPSIRDKVWSTFLRGDHDTAVFQAFKEVEVAVRSACGWGPDKIGVNLMRDAFKPHEGPLANTARLEAEQIAERDLFAGAIGSYKNPQSHRHVGIPLAEEAAEMIILASHLLRIVEARASTAAQPAEAAP